MAEFDFEKDIQKMLPEIPEDFVKTEIGNFKLGDQKHRIIVCKYWLLGLCHSGNNCSFLHKLDKSKMPACKHGKLCKIKNCPLKHVAEEEIEECLFYKQGFCYNGPKCTRRHIKRTPDECPIEANFEPPGSNTGQPGKKSKTNQPNENFKVTLCTHWLLNGNCPFDEECHFAHGEDEINEGYQPNVEFLQDSDIYDPTAGRLDANFKLPYPVTAKNSYFLIQAPDLRSLAISKRIGIWRVPTRIVPEMNAAFRSTENVILFFSVRPLRGIYGVARMMNLIPNPHMAGMPISPDFSVKWLRSMRISLRTVAQLKLGTAGLFVGRTSIDARFENKVGLDMYLTSFRKPIWNWDRELKQAEASIRIVDKDMNTSTTGEYFPRNGIVPYYLPPDELFAQEWVERAAISPNEKGLIILNKMSAVENVDFYTGDLPGFIAVGMSPIVEEMFAKRIFGLPMQMKDVPIHPNVPLFIFDSQMQVMLGIFYADSEVGIDLDPTAFTRWAGVRPGGGSPFPIQFKFKIALEAPSIPIQDPELLNSLRDYVHTMGPIGVEETRKLANLFAKRAALAKLNSPNPNAGGSKFGPKGNKPGGVSMLSGNAGIYKPPFSFVEVVPVDIKSATIFDIKKKILGVNASYIMQIVETLGSKQSIRIRLRGIGSGFYEGADHQELQEPLHFNVSAESEELLAAVVSRVKELIENARKALESPSIQ